MCSELPGGSVCLSTSSTMLYARRLGVPPCPSAQTTTGIATDIAPTSSGSFTSYWKLRDEQIMSCSGG